jgi:hypothetical protein
VLWLGEGLGGSSTSNFSLALKLHPGAVVYQTVRIIHLACSSAVDYKKFMRLFQRAKELSYTGNRIFYVGLK